MRKKKKDKEKGKKREKEKKQTPLILSSTLDRKCDAVSRASPKNRSKR
jgi:hypothetical protein